MFEKGAKISASEIKALKAEVKAEMLRRNQNGSLSSYGGTSWEFSAVPNQGGVIKTEHFDKIATPVKKINPSSIPDSADGKFPALDILNAKLQSYKTMTGKSSSSHGCSASCSGLCYNSCTSCSGCTGCSGCGSGCAYGCSGCGSGCASGCSGCGGACSSNCSGTCSGVCSGCGSACSNNCSGGCAGGCLGCGNNCTGGCSMSCARTCTNGIGYN